MKRVLGVVLLAVLLIVGMAPSAGADGGEWRLADKLAATWAKVMSEPPSDEYCLEVDGRKGTFVAPFAPLDVNIVTCEVPRGTEVLVIPITTECSTAEPPPYYGRNEKELRRCARAHDMGTTVRVTLDGKTVRAQEVTTDLTHIVFPAINIFDVPPGPADFVAHGWVTSLQNLGPGTHSIVTSVAGPEFSGVSTTKIIVSKTRNND